MGNENLVKAENYEMAQQAKVATNIIADMITFYRNNLKADNNDTYKIENTEVSTWAVSNKYTGFGYQAQIDIADLSESDFVNVVFGVNDAVSGNYAPAIEIYSGYILIFSKVNATITIPTIEITKIDL